MGFLWGFVFNKIYHLAETEILGSFRGGLLTLIYKKMAYVTCLFSLCLKRGVKGGPDVEIVLAEEESTSSGPVTEEDGRYGNNRKKRDTYKNV